MTYDPELYERGLRAALHIMKRDPGLYQKLAVHWHPSTERGLRDSALFCHYWENWERFTRNQYINGKDGRHGRTREASAGRHQHGPQAHL